tara:strand:- start:7832 stop:8023 length:192 start_codon:yes stop_codon:yes gene_type:complete
MKWWILLLVTAHADGNITVQPEDRFNYKPSCQMAQEARQMYLNAAHEYHKGYICLAEPNDDNS